MINLKQLRQGAVLLIYNVYITLYIVIKSNKNVVYKGHKTQDIVV